MAIPFNSSTIGDVPMMKPGQGGGAAVGYNQPLTVDPSIIDQMQTAGLQVNATSYTSAYALSAFRPTQLEVLPGKLVPAFYDQGGSNYIINGNDDRVFLVTMSPVNPDGTTSTGGGQPMMAGMMSGGTTPAPTIPVQNPTFQTSGLSFVPTTGGVTPPPPGGGGPPIGPGPSRPAMGAGLGSGKIYSTFAIDDIIPNQQETVTRAMWSKNVDELTTLFTSSIYTDEQKQYFYEIYAEDPATATDCELEPQFSIAYGHVEGSGSAPVGSAGANTNDSPTRAVYNQYRLLCLEPDETTFQISGSADDIFAININRARFREAVDEGNLEIAIGGETFIDDSIENPAIYKQGSEVYKIVSGSLENGIADDTYSDGSQKVYGLLFRRKGIIILDASAIEESTTLATLQLGVDADYKNALKLYDAMGGTSGASFKARSAERVKSTHFFVRAKNADYNFSNNPTFVTGSEGELLHPEMYNDPKTYITTVGLYNPSKELVAVAKLSQPIQKSFKEEALIKIKLDF